MNKITKLNTKDIYKLVDVEGYLAQDAYHKEILKDFPEILEAFQLDSISILKTNANHISGTYKDKTIISYYKYKFFRKLGN